MTDNQAVLLLLSKLLACLSVCLFDPLPLVLISVICWLSLAAAPRMRRCRPIMLTTH